MECHRVKLLRPAPCALALVLLASGSAAPGSPGPEAISAQAFPAQPLSFVENRGQVDRRVDYYGHAGGASLFFTRRGVTFALTGKRVRWTVEQAFVGGRADVRPHASGPAPGIVNSFVGPRPRWRTGLKRYGRIVYRDVWPGVDVVYSGRTTGLEYRFVIEPGADPAAIGLVYRGAHALRRALDGRLLVATPAGNFAEQAPVAYQQAGARRLPVRAGFAVRGLHYGFRLGAYDPRRALVVDPVVFGYAGFLGGSGADESFDLAVDPAGNAYLSGSTLSPDFPATPGVLGTPRGDRDAFVAKVDRTGRLVYADYVGGAGHQDDARGVAIDRNGNAYIAGSTDSPQSSFPVTVGPDLTFNGGEDAYVAKINPTGTKLLYAGYIGGIKGEGGRDLSVDANGNAYVAGTTSTADSTFPAKVGPDLTYGGGNHDGFVAKVNASGNGLVWCSYIGGDGNEDNVRGTAPDASGSVYITGHADSSEATFPVTVGPELAYNGNTDGYVGKINSSGTAFVYLGFVGGSGKEQPRRVAVDGSGNAYIAGSTESRDWPVTVGPALAYGGGMRDAFVTKVSPDGTALVYSGYIGGPDDDQIYGLDVDAAGSAYVVGLTTSTEATFPVWGGPDVTYNGGQDGFVAKVNAAGTGLDFAGYIGGDGAELAHGVGFDSAGRVYVSGTTASTEPTFPSLGAPDHSYNGGTSDAFLVQVAPIKGARISVTPSGSIHAGVPFTVTAVMRDGTGRTVTGYNGPATWSSVDGALSPTQPADFVDGVSTTTATISAPFHNDRISVASGGATSASALFNVLGPLHHIALSGIPSSVATGQDFTVRATAKDALNDTITDYAAPATWSDRSGTLTPAAPSDFTAGVSATTARIGTAYRGDQITLTSGSATANSAQFDVG